MISVSISWHDNQKSSCYIGKLFEGETMPETEKTKIVIDFRTASFEHLMLNVATIFADF